MTRIKTAIWRVLLGSLVVSLAAFLIAGVVRTAREPSYDYDASIAKLKEIGRRLQVYRGEAGYLSPSQRTSSTQAGLPNSMSILGIRRGKAWSTPNGIQDFKVQTPRRGVDPGPNTSHFMQLYWEPKLYPPMGDISAFFAERGESLPVLADTNMNSVEDIVNNGSDLVAIVLRLDGTVSIVHWNVRERNSLLTR